MPSNTNTREMEGELNGAPAPDKVCELSPVAYLVSVMHDPDAAPRDRVKAARVAAPYLHHGPEIDDMPIVIEDPFGFPVDPVLAKEIREDQQRAETLRRPLKLDEAMAAFKKGQPLSELDGPEYRDLTAQIDRRLKKIGCPASYGGMNALADAARISYLSPNANGRVPKKPLTAEEAAERDHLQFRLSVYHASAACEAHARMAYLLRNRASLTPVEVSELDELLSRYPERHAQGHRMSLGEAMNFGPKREINRASTAER